MSQKTINYEGKQLSYSVIGEGKPVMLVHGFGEKGYVWKQQVQALQSDYRLIIPELPGTTGSAMIDDMSMEGMADALRAIIEAEFPEEKITVIGHSMGGYITLAFAERHPELLNGFGLFHSSAFADSDEKKATRKKGIEFIQEHGSIPFLKNTSPNLFSPHTKVENPGLVDDFIAGLNNFLPEALVSYYEAMMKRPDRTDVLKNATVPVLFVLGQHDTAVPFEDGLKQVNLPEKSYIHTLRHSGHMGMLEEPEKANMILKEYLASIS